jgi:hypothetical protein
MIESRAQRKASSLLRRRKIAILVTLAIVVVLGVILAVVHNYVKTVIPYYDVDDIEYHIKKVNGIHMMFDKDGNLLPIEQEFGYYRTAAGTLIQLDAATGEIRERVIPDFYDPTLSETVDHQKILVFPNIEGKDISAIRIYNANEPQGYTLMRYNVDTMLADDNSDFVLMYDNMESTMLTLKKDLVSALYVAAGYSLATSKINPEEVANLGYAEYGLEACTRTRRSWYYRIVLEVDGVEHVYNVNLADGRFLTDEEVKDSIDPTYDMILPTEGIITSRAIALAKNALNPSRDSKIKVSASAKIYMETYEYSPAYYIVASKTGEKHKMVIGDRLINGGGYYAQYEDVETGERKPAVYVLNASIKDTLLSPAKTIVEPMIAFPSTTNDYFDVHDFTIEKKESDERGDYDKIISFSYIDLADREDTVEGIHPYKFSDGQFAGFRPNYDNIDACLISLMDSSIKDIIMLSPTAADKIAYGISKPMLDDDGNIVYDADGNIQSVYDPEYKVTFYRYTTDDDGKKYRFKQAIYISAPNADGNYYVHTVIDFPEIPIGFDMICEVSGATLNFLSWDTYDWVYPEYLQTGILYTDTLNVKLPDNEYKFDLVHDKADGTTTLSIIATDAKGNTVNTFASLIFKDADGNQWYVTPAGITVYDPKGTEVKPISRHYEHNSIGEQVRVIDTQVLVEDGSRVRITKDYIYINRPDGTEEKLLRYHTTLFKKLFQLLSNVSIVDSYDITEEEETALLADPKNYVGTVVLKDDTGREIVAEYYNLTARKMYIKVNGSGGFYVSSNHVKKGFEAINSFMNGTDFSTDY